MIHNLKIYEPKLLSFGVISDVHIGYYEDACTEDFERALTGFRNRGISKVSICGDITSYGSSSDVNEFKRIAGLFPDITIRACNGNHDVKLLDDSKWQQELGTEPCFYEMHGDIAIVYLSMVRTATHSCADPYSENIEWLRTTLQALAGKQIFLFMHFPIYFKDEESGSPGLRPKRTYGFTEDSTEPEAILEILRQTKNVTVFSGHSHIAHFVQDIYPTIIFRNDEENNLRYVHIPSLTVPRDENMDYIERYNPQLQPSAGYVVDVYKDRVKISGLEFNDEKEFRFGKENFKCTYTYVPNVSSGVKTYDKMTITDRVATKVLNLIVNEG